MNDKEKLKEEIRVSLKNDANKFPFIAQFWEIEIYGKNNIETNPINFGHYKTKTHTSTYFYKAISKIIDFSKLDE
ncbi:hypothetical protein LXD69_02045 [Flavobacterium sediminilitoris]|uniref:Uncharacterized protein n=1 Tax=Flavobacterium sediminilitoris TaxID=2024526 RepID=A0ABY4HRB4_9FLAO|nr:MULTISPECIES: hypothetical protein [Flavobacterium]UOX34309.1 hypothetical protein LXD69_02045 [Flavobacterium sediminilitoris]